ncbi:amidohydrolase [Thermus filiformis]|uniref:Amidohydrolase n=1 Tax=Thermus filiformis TaxID=276 RepID=A0A0A2X795_THEFI|nr:amidohydrolase family protein [Thermus filiformis]KGQ21089.1 amidohydrolase [Thermus filiformis]
MRRIAGRIYVPDAQGRFFPYRALWVREGRVAGLEPGRGEGEVVLPGFHDAHVHVWKVGQLLTDLLDLRGVGSLEELARLLRERDRGLPPGVWLLGRGWNEAELGGVPDRGFLDRVVPGRPVLLTRTCAHIHAANTDALRRAGLTPDTPSPPGGEVRYQEGLLLERAYGLVERALPRRTVEDYRRYVLAGARHLLSRGITSALEAGADPLLLEAYRSLDREGLLPIRVSVLAILRPDGEETTYPLPEPYRSDRLVIAGVKLFADGGLSGASAAVSRPYREVGGKGVLRLSAQEVFELALPAHRRGLFVATHAIGDVAIREVLQAYAALYREAPLPVRHRVEHFGLPGPRELALARALGVWAVPQPIFLAELRANFLRYLPEGFLSRCYNLERMERAGLRVAYSSDAPVVREVSPLQGALAAARMPLAGGGVPFGRALFRYLRPEASGLEAARLQPGQRADLVVFSQDPFRHPEEARVVRVEVDGETVFSDG